MSDHTAVTGVSRTLQTLLQDYMRSRTLQNFTVTLSRPDVNAGDSGPRVNLFLYQVTEDAHLKNQEIPGSGHPAAYGHPPLSLDLHYLLTAYGLPDTDDAQTHLLLADAMLVLHDIPVITDQLRRRFPLQSQPVLDAALLGEFERIKTTIEPIDIEDLTNIWSATNQPYRLSVGYRVTVAQIESERERPAVQIVGEPPPAGPRIRAIPLDRPHIDSIAVVRGGEEFSLAYARIGDILVLRGGGLGGTSDQGLSVRLGDLEVPAATVSGGGSTLRFPVPDDVALQPGVQTVEVVRQVELGEPPKARDALRSNIGAFVVVPSIADVAPRSAALPQEIRITGTQLFRADMDTIVWVHDQAIAVPDPAVSQPPTATEVRVVVSGLASRPGDPYRVAVRVNGAETVREVRPNGTVIGTFEVT